MKLHDLLHPFLRTAGLAEQAAVHAHKIVERWDVPHQVMVDGKMVRVPADLDDQKPRLWGMADGRRITSQLTLDEAENGGTSPAIPVGLALVPAGVALFLLLSSLSVYLGWIGLVVALVGVFFAYRTVGFFTTVGLVVLSSLPIAGAVLGNLPFISRILSIIHH